MQRKRNYIEIAFGVYIIICMLMTFLRVFDGNFWGDEAYSIILAKKNIKEIIFETANDVHPPLYYLVLKGVCEIVGYGEKCYHLVSVLTYFIMVIFSVTKIRKNFGMITSFVVVSCATWLRSSSMYNLEVRMYSLGACLILISFLTLYEVLSDEKNLLGFVLHVHL